MELLLNSLWVLIALGALGVWRFRWAPQKREPGRNRLREWAAFICALVLLFFAVSLTDDLHANLVCFDECAARRQSIITGAAHASPHSPKFAAGPSAAVLPLRASFGSPRVVLAMAVSDQAFASQCESGVNSCRPPPASSL